MDTASVRKKILALREQAALEHLAMHERIRRKLPSQPATTSDAIPATTSDAPSDATSVTT